MPLEVSLSGIHHQRDWPVVLNLDCHLGPKATRRNGALQFHLKLRDKLFIQGARHAGFGGPIEGGTISFFQTAEERELTDHHDFAADLLNRSCHPPLRVFPDSQLCDPGHQPCNRSGIILCRHSQKNHHTRFDRADGGSVDPYLRFANALYYCPHPYYENRPFQIRQRNVNNLPAGRIAKLLKYDSLLLRMTARKDSANTTSLNLLKASEQQLFETLMEQSADRIYIKDVQGRIVVASQALAEMHGYENRHEIEGLTDFDLFTEEHAQQAHEDEQEIIRTGVPFINKIEKETWTDGSSTWVSSSKSPLRLKGSECAGIIGISRDITAEFIAREKLMKNEQRLREQNEILHEDLQSARHVQEVMIPGRVPLIPGIQLAYLWKPMSSVGGDILSFPRNPDKVLLFFMGDVSGHGITAAFYTVLLKYLSSHEAEHYSNNPQNYLDAVNTELSGRIENGFVTGLAGHFGDLKEDGSRQLILAHAGHPYVLIGRAATGKIERLQMPPGIVMGIKGSKASKPTSIALHPGDRFYAFTDGLIEASKPNGEEYGLDAFIANLEELATQPLQTSLEIIHKRVCTFTERPDQQDDMTCLAFEMS